MKKYYIRWLKWFLKGGDLNIYVVVNSRVKMIWYKCLIEKINFGRFYFFFEVGGIV